MACDNSKDQSPKATCGTCGDSNCSASKRKEGENDGEFSNRQKLQSRLCRIRHKVLVMSGKGGVGKSTVAVNLATSLALEGKSVGLLDVDIHGPSIPTMLGLEGQRPVGGEEGMVPIELGSLKIMSIGFLLGDPDDAVIWRGPMKMGVIQQFLRDVDWGDLDFLIIDAPPGTGDEPLSVCQSIEGLDGAVIVTTPQKVAAVDVRKSITFCRQLKVPVLGVVENMSGFVCPKCGEVTHILRSGGGERLATDMGVPFLGAIPIDPQIAEACDNGQAFIHHFAHTHTAALMHEIIKPIAALDSKNEQPKELNMKIAIPLADGKLCVHFGHCETFALVDADPAARKITGREDVVPPPHEPGLLPKWLAEKGVGMVIAGGMGQRAQGIFAEQGIKTLVGAPVDSPEKLVEAYLAGNLQAGDNTCDH